MSRLTYPDHVWTLFVEAPGAGRPLAAPEWVVGEAHEPISETYVRFHLRGPRERPVEARYEVRGCPFTVAAAASLALKVNGQGPLPPRFDARQLLQELAAPVPKLGRILVVEEAYRRALQRLPSIA